MLKKDKMSATRQQASHNSGSGGGSGSDDDDDPPPPGEPFIISYTDVAEWERLMKMESETCAAINKSLVDHAKDVIPATKEMEDAYNTFLSAEREYRDAVSKAGNTYLDPAARAAKTKKDEAEKDFRAKRMVLMSPPISKKTAVVSNLTDRLVYVYHTLRDKWAPIKPGTHQFQNAHVFDRADKVIKAFVELEDYTGSHKGLSESLSDTQVGKTHRDRIYRACWRDAGEEAKRLAALIDYDKFTIAETQTTAHSNHRERTLDLERLGFGPPAEEEEEEIVVISMPLV